MHWLKPSYLDKPPHHVMITAQKIKFAIKDFSSKCDQIRSFQRIWSHYLEKSLMENFIFCAVDGFHRGEKVRKKLPKDCHQTALLMWSEFELIF